MPSVRRKVSNFRRILQTEGAKQAFTRYMNYFVQLMWTYKITWTPRRLYLPLNRVPVDRPIFVVGTQGAGLTLLTRMIRRHPRVVMVGGGPSFWTGLDEMDKHPLGHKRFPDVLTLRAPGYRNMTGREKEHPMFGLERSWVYATDELYASYRKTAEDASDLVCEALRRKIRQSIRAYAIDIHHARFLDKSQSYALKIPLIKRCLPDALFVVQTRNPYVMCWREVSARPEHKYRLWKTRPSLEQGLRLAAQHWRNTYKTAWGDLEGRPYGLFIRFEDLITSPEETLKQVLAFVDLDFFPDLLPQAHHTLPLGSKEHDKWYPIRKGANEKYMQELPDFAVRIIEEELGDIAEKLGYYPPK